MSKTGVLHLIPNVLAEGKIEVIPTYLLSVIQQLKYFGVEEIRSARRFLKAMDRQINVDALSFFIINEHEQKDSIALIELLKQGKDVGYLSEAGCPGIADPGQELVAAVHAIGAVVKPYVGPNSIFMALMASGFNGQHFQFHGYLPNKQPALSIKIKEIEMESRKKNCTQLFIETPYRNRQLLEELLQHGNKETLLCIACDLTAETEFIKTQSLEKWKKSDISFHKRPAVFVLFAG